MIPHRVGPPGEHQERRLEGVVHVRRLVQVPPADGPDQPAVAADDLRERLRVPGQQEPGEQVGVGGGGRGGSAGGQPGEHPRVGHGPSGAVTGEVPGPGD
ncbi:MAG: hypothetical protein U0871_12845 [Gemmataceae bacterium]